MSALSFYFNVISKRVDEIPFCFEGPFFHLHMRKFKLFELILTYSITINYLWFLKSICQFIFTKYNFRIQIYWPEKNSVFWCMVKRKRYMIMVNYLRKCFQCFIMCQNFALLILYEENWLFPHSHTLFDTFDKYDSFYFCT